MQVIAIDSMEDPRVASYRNVREADLKGRDALFMAEGRFVVSLLLREGRFPVESVFLSEAALEALRPMLESIADPPPVYVASRSVMGSIVGFDIHRGCLAAGRRLPVPEAQAWLGALAPDTRLLVATEEISNHDNMGGVFRNASAFGAGGVLISNRCCDPLYRKAIRVSMGHALRLPYATLPVGAEGVSVLREQQVFTIALTPARGSISIQEAAQQITLDQPQRVCLLLGSEGDGLSPGRIEGADLRVRIPIDARVDSLNASVAAAIAMQRLSEAMGLHGDLPTGPVD